MSTDFDNMVKTDFATILSASGEVSEQVTLKPKNAAERLVYANVDRNPPEAIGSGGDVYRPSATFTVQNNATTGVTMAETATGLTVTYNVRYGDTASVRTVNARLAAMHDADAGTITIEVA